MLNNTFPINMVLYKHLKIIPFYLHKMSLCYTYNPDIKNASIYSLYYGKKVQQFVKLLNITL